MRHYCTLTDIKYLPRALAMYESLERHSSEEFRLSYLALDKECANTLDHLAPELVNLVDLAMMHFLVDVSMGPRTYAQFCWTMASVFTDFLMKNGPTDDATYLDADLFFFSDPKVIFDEIADRSIGIIEHRFIPSKRHLIVNGRFNVGLVHFKNTPVGRECLSRWAAQCRERCDASTCGDQKYLDEWPDKYGKEVAIIENIGAGLAPWNMANYQLTKGPRVNGKPVVFFHAHEFSDLGHGQYRMSNYDMRPEDIQRIWKPYIAAYEAAKESIARLHVPA
jgi:Nucleotide-diphospho-sugar transferase